MTPPGVHINKTAVAVVVTLVIVLIVGFKFKSKPITSEVDVEKFIAENRVDPYKDSKKDIESSNKARDNEVAVSKGEENKKKIEDTKNTEDLKKEEDSKREEKKQTVSFKKQKMASDIPDWKTVNLDEFKIPADIMEAAGKIEVKEVEYEVMNMKIFGRTVKPVGECKGGVILLHGMRFTSKNWEEIKTLQYIGAMGYTPVAVDLPGYGNSDKKDVEDKAKFLKELIKTIDFNGPVIVSPSMSGGYSMPFYFDEPSTAANRSHGFIPVAPVGIDNFKDKVKDLKIPAALVYGENDKNFRTSVEEILGKIPNSHLFMLKGAGHPAYLDKPDEWHKILYVFLPAAFK